MADAREPTPSSPPQQCLQELQHFPAALLQLAYRRRVGRVICGCMHDAAACSRGLQASWSWSAQHAASDGSSSVQAHQRPTALAAAPSSSLPPWHCRSSTLLSHPTGQPASQDAQPLVTTHGCGPRRRLTLLCSVLLIAVVVVQLVCSPQLPLQATILVQVALPRPPCPGPWRQGLAVGAGCLVGCRRRGCAAA